MRDYQLIELLEPTIKTLHEKKIGDKKWKCVFCHHIFPHNFTAYHVKRHQNNNRSGHINELKVALAKTDLNALYKCEAEACGKRFNRRDHLKKHMSTCKELKKQLSQHQNLSSFNSNLPKMN